MKFKYGIFILFFSINCFAHHPGNQIDADKPYPSINLTVIKDKIDGYNIFIDLKNLPASDLRKILNDAKKRKKLRNNLNPSEIGGENISNSGYLQLFINDIRITRIYSDWVHVPQRFFNLKENFIKITIHSYLHDQFTIKGKPIEHIVKVNDN